ncbi:MAG: radical SAM protein [Chloroflexota bacterium]|nr:radical SAM protein [Chloroflexota bacterium]
MSDSEPPVHPGHLNIASIAACTRALGPGKRGVIWVQGCPLNCRGCLAPDWIPFVRANLLKPDEVLAQLDLDLITGLTFSGGEPMEQAAGLAELVRLARKQKDLDLICFTGYRYERLLDNPPNAGVSELLGHVDVLIDGPFVAGLAGSVGLRGSTNQRIIHLTSRLKEHSLEIDQRKIELTIGHGELGFIGIPTPGILLALQNAGAVASERME